MEGYVKIYRSILDLEWAGVPEMLSLWLRMLLKAEPKDRRWKGVVIRRGQFVTTVRDLAEESGLSLQKTRTILERLKATQEITQSPTQRYTIVTICNYDRYNSVEDGEQHNQQHKEQHTGNTLATHSKTPIRTAVEDGKKEVVNTPKAKKPESEPALADNSILSVNNNYHSDNNYPSIIENKKNNKENFQKKEEKQTKKDGPFLGEEFTLTGDDRKPAYDFVSPMFEKPFMAWLDYKRERKESYKSRKSLKVCYTHLVNMSHGSPDTAMAIVEQSMANNWAGLFELKNENNGHGNNNRPTKEQEREQRLQGYTNLVARLVASAREKRAAGAEDERR